MRCLDCYRQHMHTYFLMAGINQLCAATSVALALLLFLIEIGALLGCSADGQQHRDLFCSLDPEMICSKQAIFRCIRLL